jgi:hypothetical protein
MVSFESTFAQRLNRATIAKKNERIEADLEEQKTKLASVKAELEKLQSAPVRPHSQTIVKSVV